MIDSFHIAATGMQAQHTQVDVVANNLANLNTMGFKKSRVDFEDLLYRESARAAGELGRFDITAPVGMGTATSAVTKVFTLGGLKSTDRPLDLAIQGAGFFEVLLPNGQNAYTRNGALKLNNEGLLVNSDGYAVSPSVHIPSDAEQISVHRDGTVFATVPNESKPIEIGRLELANFVNPSALTPVGDNLFVPSQGSGDALYGEPGKKGVGEVIQGFLEGSNVNLVEELTGLVLAQRGYEVNARVVQVSDEMLAIVNNLRR